MAEKIYEDTAGKTFETQAEAAASNTSLGTNPMTINSNVLSGSTTPIVLPKTTSTPTTSGLALTVNGITSQAKTAATAEPPPQPTQPDFLTQFLQQSSAQKKELAELRESIQGDIGRQASQEAQFAKEEDLYKKRTAARALSDQIDQMDKDYRDEIAAIKLNPEGKFGGALQADINKATDRYNNNRANVALSYKVAAGDYNDAAQIVNDKVTSLRNQNAQKLQAYQLTADAIFNDLTESEKLIVQTNINKMNEQNKNLEDAYASVLSIASQNGAPASVLAAIDDAKLQKNASLATMLAAAGTYGQAVETSVIEANNRKLLINNKTGAVIKDLGVADIEAGGGGGIIGAGSPQAGEYADVLNTILGSGKFTKDQARAMTNAINNGEDPFTVVKNQAKSLLGQTGDTKLTSYEVAREQLEAVKTSLNQYYAAGGKTSLLSGSYEKVINKLGEVNDPKLVSIATEIASSLQIYRNAVSGTAYSVQEGVDIASIFPGINKSQGLNTAILNGRAKAFQSTIDSTYRSVLGKAYDRLKELNAGDVPPESATPSLQSLGVTVDDEALFDSVAGSTPTASGGGGFFSNLLKGIFGN